MLRSALSQPLRTASKSFQTRLAFLAGSVSALRALSGNLTETILARRAFLLLLLQKGPFPFFPSCCGPPLDEAAPALEELSLGARPLSLTAQRALQSLLAPAIHVI